MFKYVMILPVLVLTIVVLILATIILVGCSVPLCVYFAINRFYDYKETKFLNNVNGKKKKTNWIRTIEDYLIEQKIEDEKK